MGSFLPEFALSFSATLLLVSGIGHLLRPREFANVLRAHGVFRGSFRYWIAAGICALELLTGGLAASFLPVSASRAGRAAVLAAAACAGVAFAAYLRRLISTGNSYTSCGCSPLAAPLTRASLAPALALAGVAVAGLGGTALSGPEAGPDPGLIAALPCLWGVTLSGLTMLYPAAVLQI